MKISFSFLLVFLMCFPAGLHAKSLWDISKANGGSAWALDRQGHWVTAKHVTFDCSEGIYIQKPAQKRRNALFIEEKSGIKRAYAAAWLYGEHKRADISIIVSETSDRFLSLSPHRKIDSYMGKLAFAIGFPDGEPGEVMLRLIGRQNWAGKGFGIHSDVWVWKIEKKNPSHVTMHGLSGGPVLDEDGHVIGIMQGANDQEAVVFTVPPVLIIDFIADYDAPTKGAVQADIDALNFMEVAKDLRKNMIITRAMCLDSE